MLILSVLLRCPQMISFGVCSQEFHSTISVGWKTIHCRQRVLRLLRGFAVGWCVWFWQVNASVIGKMGGRLLTKMSGIMIGRP